MIADVCKRIPPCTVLMTSEKIKEDGFDYSGAWPIQVNFRMTSFSKD
ncbi:MAG: hypothetical protein Q7J68_07965 [Thermoplasmata archaeon]|nr:hypothetical protein [Thermoplasmata archaeon]